MDYFWKQESILSIDTIKDHQSIMELLFIGGIGGSLGRTIAETFFTDWFKDPMTLNGSHPPTNILMVKGTNTNSGAIQGSSSASGKGVQQLPEGSIYFLSLAKEIFDFFEKGQKPLIEWYKNMNNPSHQLNMEGSNVTPFSAIVQRQGHSVLAWVRLREAWVNSHAQLFEQKYQDLIEKSQNKTNQMLEDYLKKVDEIADKKETGDVKGKLREYFNATNAYRNAVYKELNKMDEIVHSHYRVSEFYKKPESKQLINVDYPAAKKSFIEGDETLRKKISEVLNAKKK